MVVEGKEVEADEYESDPEDAIALSAMRRREASDDEEEDGGGRRGRTAEIGSDGESDDQGAAPGYEDEEEQEDYDEEYEEEIEEADEIVAEEEVEKDLEGSRRKEEEDGQEKEGEEKGKKENEPYAVPTAGAFYMHDDRFQEKGRGRGRGQNRRMPGGRRLWETKDNRAWVHDRFEEMKLQDAQYDRGRRNSRGRFRGRGGGNNQGAGRGFVKGNNRPRAYYDEINNQTHDRNSQNRDSKNQNRDSNNQDRDSNNQNRPQKSVRGRGPRRYEAISRNNEGSVSRRVQPARSQESQSSTGASRPLSQTSNMQHDAALPKKDFASNLNYASPPFYPSSSSKQGMSVTEKMDAQIGKASNIISSPMNMENNYLSLQSGSMLREKALVSAQMHSSGSTLTSANTTLSSQSRVQGRSLSITSQSYKSTAPVSQVSRVPQQIQAPITQQKPQSQFQPAVRGSSQRIVPASRNQASPPHALTMNSSEVGETCSPPGLNNSKTQLIPKGKPGTYRAEKGSFLYNGAQVIGTSGATGLSQSDQNFPGTPALLPVMQFAGQHHNGIPTVGMALPGYMAQPQLGFGNSEMTWVPVLAGAAGALGASYPCIALDGSYYPLPSGQASSANAIGSSWRGCSSFAVGAITRRRALPDTGGHQRH
ncbi:uncharacterized protein LOC109851402 isoform X2 [Asparagus officinalis]|uniref:uncharacterized protein LOC109851402 isoform X2 n=1 Tax=Asparagus officinalis TaxID=4686 RepID=UPI00098DE5C5|nr:uncharacterized protein LOC109851402 isoform X2 [Asparagus officinalis]